MKKKLFRTDDISWGRIIVAVMAILAGFEVWMAWNRDPCFGGAKARNHSTMAQLQNLNLALVLYDTEIGGFPPSEPGLEGLVKRPREVPEEFWPRGGFLKNGKVPRDAWGNEFCYRASGESGEGWTLTSPGPDRELGTEDDLTVIGEAATPATELGAVAETKARVAQPPSAVVPGETNLE